MPRTNPTQYVWYGLLLALLVPAPLTYAQEEPFDPRKPPDDKVVKAAVKEVKRAWRRAAPEQQRQLLTRLEEHDHPASARAIGQLIQKADADLFTFGLGLLRSFGEERVELVLPDLLERRGGELELWHEMRKLAIDKQVEGCLPELRKVAAKTIPPTGSDAEDAAARKRTRAIEALGKIPHEDNLDTLLGILESYAPLEAEAAQVQSGWAGTDQSWPRFYIPARTAFNEVSGGMIMGVLEARAWRKKNPDFVYGAEPAAGEGGEEEEEP